MSDLRKSYSDDEMLSMLDSPISREGQGKGNWGHKGRPGEIGGSGGSSSMNLEKLDTSTEKRQALVTDLKSELDYLNSDSATETFGEGLLDNIESSQVFGSFSSNKPNPNDIDILVQVKGSLTQAQKTWNTTQVFKQNQHLIPKRATNTEIIFTESGSDWSNLLIKSSIDKYGTDPINLR